MGPSHPVGRAVSVLRGQVVMLQALPLTVPAMVGVSDGRKVGHFAAATMAHSSTVTDTCRRRPKGCHHRCLQKDRPQAHRTEGLPARRL